MVSFQSQAQQPHPKKRLPVGQFIPKEAGKAPRLVGDFYRKASHGAFSWGKSDRLEKSRSIDQKAAEREIGCNMFPFEIPSCKLTVRPWKIHHFDGMKPRKDRDFHGLSC